jgi:hypothetical protein
LTRSGRQRAESVRTQAHRGGAGKRPGQDEETAMAAGRRRIAGIVSAAAALAAGVAISAGEPGDLRDRLLLDPQPSVYPDQGEIAAAKLRPAIGGGTITCTVLGRSTVCN